LDRGELPIERGKVLSSDDQRRQWVINSLMCQFEIDKQKFKKIFGDDFDQYFSTEQEHIRRCVADGFIVNDSQKIKVLELGKFFIRNVGMGFDWYLRQAEGHKRFSKTV
jgi:oxygen-independent coproporphyrinogen-3 oxidase